jgi:hypothetical protein
MPISSGIINSTEDRIPPFTASLYHGPNPITCLIFGPVNVVYAKRNSFSLARNWLANRALLDISDLSEQHKIHISSRKGVTACMHFCENY